jgi:hypothetical protein
MTHCQYKLSRETFAATVSHDNVMGHIDSTHRLRCSYPPAILGQNHTLSRDPRQDITWTRRTSAEFELVLPHGHTPCLKLCWNILPFCYRYVRMWYINMVSRNH